MPLRSTHPFGCSLGFAAMLGPSAAMPLHAQDKGVLMIEMDRSAFPARMADRIRELEQSGQPAEVWATVSLKRLGAAGDGLHDTIVPLLEGDLRKTDKGDVATFGPVHVQKPAEWQSGALETVPLRVWIEVGTHGARDPKQDTVVSGALIFHAWDYKEFCETVEAQGALLFVRSSRLVLGNKLQPLSYKPLGLSKEAIEAHRDGKAEPKPATSATETKATH